MAFEELVRSWPEVREAHMLAGETDFLLKIVATDWDSYQRFLSTKLTSAPNVAHVKSAMTLRVSKAEPGVPLENEPAVEEDDAA
jgi:DNA-binding Lrp family transcriptional regulator